VRRQEIEPFGNGRYGDEHRDHLGRFRPGNRAASGRQAGFARQRQRLQKALYGAVSAEDLRAVVHKLVALAKDGNLQAIKLVLLWGVGEPAPALPSAQDTPAPEDRAF
jgi:hypothetical protein